MAKNLIFLITQLSFLTVFSNVFAADLEDGFSNPLHPAKPFSLCQSQSRELAASRECCRSSLRSGDRGRVRLAVDRVNPVQCSAEGMYLKTLKKEFGKDIVFGDGGIDTQKTLPFGTPEGVYREARERIDILDADQTVFVFNSLHNIQSDVPVENILAMYKAVDDARRR